jgi:hypothetical protein
LNQNEKEVEQLVEKIVSQHMKKTLEDFTGKQLTADITTENGNSIVKQSGNGIVYVDNTGIAYAMALFHYHLMDEKHKSEINIDTILSRLDGVISDNRKTFSEVIKSLKNND